MRAASIREGNRAIGTFIQHKDDAMPAGSGKWMIVPERVNADPVIAKRHADSIWNDHG